MNPTSLLQLLQGPFNFLRPDPEEVRRLVPDLERHAAPAAPHLPGGRERHAAPRLPHPRSPRAWRPCGRRCSSTSCAEEALQARRPPARASYDRQGLRPGLGALPRPARPGGGERHHLQLRPAVSRRSSGSTTPWRSPACSRTRPSASCARHRDRPPPRRRHQVPHPRPLPRPRALHHLRHGPEGGRRHRGGRGGAVPAPAHPHARQRPDLHRGLHRPRPGASSAATSTARCASTAATCGSGSTSWRAGTPSSSPPTASCAPWPPTCCGRDPAPRPPRPAHPARATSPTWPTLSSYNPARLLPPPLVQVWESLLLKLKEFELLHACAGCWCPSRCSRRPHGRPRAAAGPGRSRRRRAVRSPRPPGRSTSWSPGWSTRGSSASGMIYDISDFSQTLSVLHRVGRREPGRRLPHDVPLPAADQPPRPLPPDQAGEVPGRRRLLLQPRGHQPAGLLGPHPALLRPGAARGLPLRPRPAHRAQLRPLPADPDGRPARGGRALRVLRPGPGRAVAPDHRQGDAGDRRGQDAC